MNKYYKCIKCGQKYPFSKDILTCHKHSPYYSYLTLMYDYKNIKFPSSSNSTSWVKYTDLLPPQNLHLNFNEQKTPLFKLNNFGKKKGFENLYLKDESKNPTGSFKDKESACAVNQALEWQINKIFVVSSGNAALSTAAYAQKACIDCDCLIPKSLSFSKRSLISLYGGKMVELDGNYEKIYRYAIDSKYPGWNCTPGINPIKEEGVKIIGFEIWEDIGVPDVIVVPCGNGTLLFGIYKAFKELQFLKLIDKLPKLVGVQVKYAAPLKTAYDQNIDFANLANIPDSCAEAIVAQESYSAPKVMVALKDTAGEIIEVDDREILSALCKIIELESVIPEPSSAAVYAALDKLKIDKNAAIVLIQTAGGLKNLKEILELSINPKLQRF